MKFSIYFLGVFVTSINIGVTTCERKVVCYYGSWSTYRNGNGKFEVENIDPLLCTHAIYTFVGLNLDGGIRILDSWNEIDRQGFKRFNDLRKVNPNLKTLVAIGGWNEGSTSYSTVMNNDAKRRVFVQNVVQFVEEHGFNGFDLDWEYPGQRGGSQTDKAAFTKLLQELRAEFDKYGYLLSAAVAAAKSSAEISYNIYDLGKYLDFINIMTYDLHGSWEEVTGHNAPLFAGPNDDTEHQRLLNVDACIKYWLSEGAPSEKIILGMGLYGRSFTMSSPSNCAIGVPRSGAGAAGPYTREAGMLGYNEVCEKKWSEKWDDQQMVPYACSGDQFVGYDSIESIKIKSQYIIQGGLGGAMVWSVETDDFLGACHGYKFPLLTAINQVFSNNVTIPEMTASPTVNPPVTNPPVETVPPVVTDPAVEADCTKEGYIRDPMDCSVYYYCQDNNAGAFIKYNFKCPAGLFYDVNLGICEWSTSVAC